MSDNYSVDQSELFDLLNLYAENHSIGGTLQILDTLLHMLEMVVKSYTAKDGQSEGERRDQYNRVKEIVHASKTAIGKIVHYCDNVPNQNAIEKALLESMPVGICVTDVLGKIHFANKKFLQLTGLSESSIGKVNVTTLYSDSQARKRIVGELKNVTHHEEALTFKFPMKKNGKEYLVESIERNIQWEGKRNCMLAVVIDRSDAKKVEQVLKKAVHGDVTMEQMLKTVSARAKEKEIEEARRKRIEKEKQHLLTFVNSLVNLLGNIIYLEDNILGKELYKDKLLRATNIGLFAVLVLNTFDEKTLQVVFGKKSHPKPIDSIKRDLLYGIILHDIGKIGIRSSVLLDDNRFPEESKRSIIRDHVDIGANLVKILKGPYSETIKVMAHYHHKSRDGKGLGYPPGPENKLSDPREVLAKWFDVFYSFVTRRPYRNELYSYDKIVLEFLFNDRDLQIDSDDGSPNPYKYSQEIQVLLKKLHDIFDPRSKVDAYLKTQDEIKKWMQRVRLEHDNAGKRIELKKKLQRK